MKAFFITSFLFVSLCSSAQYYYKDIIGTKESAELIANYKNNKVKSVVLTSYTINNTPINNFSIRQEYLPAQQALVTITQTDYTSRSYLTTYVDANGRVIKTTDSSDGIVNNSIYSYDGAGKLARIYTIAGDSMRAIKTEEHVWQLDKKGRIATMLRITNNRDTSRVLFGVDSLGNVTEEVEKRGFLFDKFYYYYYDAQNRLTDVARFNNNAKRIIPELMFEYSAKNQIIQRHTISQYSSDYLIWRYAYNDKGLKTKEVIFNKEKEQTGKVEYQYTFSN